MGRADSRIQNPRPRSVFSSSKQRLVVPTIQRLLLHIVCFESFPSPLKVGNEALMARVSRVCTTTGAPSLSHVPSLEEAEPRRCVILLLARDD
jgi:hypothetical protein